MHFEHFVYAPAAGARYHLKSSLSDHKKRSSRGDLQLLYDCHFIKNTVCVLWVFSVTVMRRSSCWESLALLVWFFAGVNKDQQETKEEDQEGRRKQVSWQSDETVREVPSEQTHHDSYEEEVLNPCREPYTAFRSLKDFSLAFLACT